MIKILKSLANKACQEFCVSPIQTGVALLSGLYLFFQIFLPFFHKGIIQNRILKVLLFQTDTNLSLLLMAFSILLWLLITKRKINNATINELNKTISNLQSELTAKTNIAHLNDMQVKILSYLFLSRDREHSSDSISHSLNLSPQTVKFHIEELKINKMVKHKSFPSSLYITQEGRKYLIDNK